MLTLSQSLLFLGITLELFLVLVFAVLIPLTLLFSYWPIAAINLAPVHLPN
jgi:hypothetical protein